MADHLFLFWWLGLGAALGAAYLFMISRTVAAIHSPGGRSAAWVHFALRVLLAAGVLTLAARAGALPLLACLGGFLAVKSVVLRWSSGS